VVACSSRRRLGWIESGIDALKVGGKPKVTIEVVK
jgi:hypothetical protein